MREIKFRAWYKAKKRFQYWSFGEGGDRAVMLNRYGPIEQWTGLKDSQGVEIYEGDILGYLCDDGDKEYDVIEWGEEEFLEGTFVTRCLNPSVYVTSPTSAISDIAYCESRVIGNIHENPELLT